MMEQNTWRTDRLKLRPLGPGDLESVCRYACDEENTRYMIFYPHTSPEQTARFLAQVEREWAKEKPEFYEFAVELGGEVIGSVSLYVDPDRTTGELGWILRKDHWGRGYIPEAVGGVLKLARELEPELTAVRAECDSRNLSSRRVTEKIGMTLKDGNSRRTYPQTGEVASQCVYERKLI